MMVEVYLEETGQRLISERGPTLISLFDAFEPEAWEISCSSLWTSLRHVKPWDGSPFARVTGADLDQVYETICHSKIVVEVMLVDNWTKKKALLYYADNQYLTEDPDRVCALQVQVERKIVLEKNEMPFRLRSRIHFNSRDQGKAEALHVLTIVAPVGRTKADFHDLFKHSLEWI